MDGPDLSEEEVMGRVALWPGRRPGSIAVGRVKSQEFSQEFEDVSRSSGAFGRQENLQQVIAHRSEIKRPSTVVLLTHVTRTLPLPHCSFLSLFFCIPLVYLLTDYRALDTVDRPRWTCPHWASLALDSLLSHRLLL